MNKAPRVSVVADTPESMAAMNDCTGTLRELQVTFEQRFVSALHAPDDMRAFAERAWERGLRIIIASSETGHLAGMIKAFGHRLSVISVPYGVDELHKKIALKTSWNMPRGAPVIHVNNPVNAALCAADILAHTHPSLLQKTDAFHAKQHADVVASNTKSQGDTGSEQA